MNNRLDLNKIVSRYRALFLFVITFTVLSFVAPDFFNFYNITTILQGASLNAIVAIGFTAVLIAGELDLSVGAVVMFSGMLSIGLQPDLTWGGSFLVAIAVGALIGLINGLLVAKAKTNSFIVTLGTMTMLHGLLILYSGGGSVLAQNFVLSDWLTKPIIPLLPPIVLFMFVLVGAASFVLQRTGLGRGLFMVGSNPEAAWEAGLNRDMYIIGTFVLSATISAVGGALVAIKLGSMPATSFLGQRTLMKVLAAVIIGGTSLDGGEGSILQSFFAVFFLVTVLNAIGTYGLGFSYQILANGLIMAAVVLYGAYTQYKERLTRGERPYLLEELENR